MHGEGNGNPLQYSCLENPVDRGTRWAAVHRVEQSRIWLKRLSMHACTGEGTGSPLQCSCLENPRDGEPGGPPPMGPHSRTRLQRQQPQRLSSSSSSGMRVSWILHKNSPSTTTWINRHTPSSSAWHGVSLLSTLLNNNWVNQLPPPRWGSLNQIENTRWWIFPSLFPSWTLS